MIEVKNLVKRYGDLIALDHFNLNVRSGEIFGLLGPNGSGKTTAINCMLSLLKYDKGEIRLFGEPMTPNNYRSKQKIGVVMQNVAVFNELTVYENIDYFCGLYVNDKRKRKELVEEALRFAGLEDFRKFIPKKLSGGLLRRLNIACGIAHKPELIFLDEPTVAVDPQEPKQYPGGNQEAEPGRSHYHLYLSLHGRGGTAMHPDHDYGQRKGNCNRYKRGAQGHDPYRREANCRAV